MRIIIGIGVVLFLCAFSPGLVKRKHDKFVVVAEYLLNNKLQELTKEDVKDPFIKKIMNELKIDGVVNGNWRRQGIIEPIDSVVIFVHHGRFLSWKYERVFYDYAKTPRHFVDTYIALHDYCFKKVSDRFYFSSEDSGR